MSLWWLWGGGGSGADTGVAERNAPSLWSAGVVWGPTAAPGQRAYWQASSSPQTGRTGPPELCVAIAGRLVLEQLQSASWSLGRSDWMSVLSPTSATFTFAGEPAASPNDDIVASLMSDLTAYHSGALWVGRVDGLRTRRDIDGQTYTTVSATDVIGVLGKAKGPASIAAGHTLASLVEMLAASAGVALQVDVDPLVTLPTLTAATDLSGSVLDLVNRAERSSNALLFLRGDGRLHAAMRDTTGATSVGVVSLDGDDSPATWEEDVSLRDVVTRWVLGDGVSWSTDTAASTLEAFGDQTYSATDMLVTDPAPYAALIASDVMANPRPVIVDGSFPIRDHAQRMLSVAPLDRVAYDGSTYQVMSVRHDVSPRRVADGVTVADWRVTITADATQEALAGAPDPGPVEPPGLNEVTIEVVSTKSMYVYRQSGSDLGDATSLFLPVGYDSGVRRRSLVHFEIAWPAGFVRVVKATLRLRTWSTTSVMGDRPRMYVRNLRESWTESSGTVWDGPTATSAGERVKSVPRAANQVVDVSITAIAQAWRERNDGLRLQAVDEDKAFRATMFHSDDSDEAYRPRLLLTCEVIS